MDNQIRKRADASIKATKLSQETQILGIINNICRGYYNKKYKPLDFRMFSIFEYEGTDDFLRVGISDGKSRYQIEFCFKDTDNYGDFRTKINICGLKDPKNRKLIAEEWYKFNVSKYVYGENRLNVDYLAEYAMFKLFKEVEKYNEKDILTYTIHYNRCFGPETASCSAENADQAMEKFDKFFSLTCDKKFVTKIEVEDKNSVKKITEFDEPEEYLSKEESDKRECESRDSYCVGCSQYEDDNCWGIRNTRDEVDDCENECCGDCDCCENECCEPCDSVDELEELEEPWDPDDEHEWEEDEPEQQDEEEDFDEEVSKFVLELPSFSKFCKMSAEEREKVLLKMKDYAGKLLDRSAKT